MFIPTQHACGEATWLKKKNLWLCRGLSCYQNKKISFKGSYFERVALSVMAVK
jgi:hypothetical protein